MNTSLIGTVALAASTLTGWAGDKPDTCRVYFGTSAKEDQCGIYMAELDMKTGTLSDSVRVSKARRPGFIAIHPDGKHMYATGAGSSFEGRSAGMVSAFNIVEDGMLSDGSLSPPSSTQMHTGSSVHPKRQNKAYAHSINTSPDGRFAFVADLGIDKIMIYRFDPTTGKLEPNDPPFTNTEPGGGPRHFTFHPNGKLAYTNLELSNKVTVFTYDAEKGTLNETQTVSTLPEDYSLPNTTAEVITSPDGRFLYVSNRGHNSIAIFSIDAETGTLTLLGREYVRGQIPRNFNIDPTGTFRLTLLK